MRPHGSWPCNCPICRVFAIPLMGYEKGRGEQVMSREQESGGDSRETPVSVGNELKELKDLVEALRESIIELRSALSEINNPFNVMRKPGKEEDEESGSSEPLIPLSASQSISPHPLHSITAQPVEGYKAGAGEGKEAGKRKEGEAEYREYNRGVEGEAKSLTVKPETSEDHGHGTLAAARSSGSMVNLPRLLKVMYMIREKAPKDNLDAMIEVLDIVGLIPGELKDVMLKIADLVEKARESGIPPERQLVLLYALAKASGIHDGPLEEEAMAHILDMLSGGEDWGRRQS